ncbi:MAG: hypothetical protein DRO67_01645 [Candidatus Asgardarchaeum californiense]|nr:MAG: hypothetical protein DRO67_01645 [Candidatus Asgardarchaeum californiense]
MSRPRFPGCVLPENCISRIVEEQNRYDRDPERYEREREERRLQEQQEEEYQQWLAYREQGRQQEEEYV